MSGGQRQRIGIARALSVDPKVVILDESTSALDVSIQKNIIDLIKRLQKEKNITILFVSHDISSVRQMCSRVLWIEKGKQIIFDQSDKVCDMYMDMKRKGMNKQVDEIDEVEDIPVKILNVKKMMREI